MEHSQLSRTHQNERIDINGLWKHATTVLSFSMGESFNFLIFLGEVVSIAPYLPTLVPMSLLNFIF